jgi:hypothetical protein
LPEITYTYTYRGRTTEWRGAEGSKRLKVPRESDDCVYVLIVGRIGIDDGIMAGGYYWIEYGIEWPPSHTKGHTVLTSVLPLAMSMSRHWTGVPAKAAFRRAIACVNHA